MACRYTYKGKTYSAIEFEEKLLSLPVEEASKYMPGVRSVPNAPFKRTWPELAFKRMVRYAAENGYDKVAWTTGEMQADRYDLSKQVDTISYDVDGDKISIRVDRNQGRLIERVVRGWGEVADLVGKEMAEKMQRGEGRAARQNEGQPKGAKIFEGLDLKVGGEGMKGFYDKMLPTFAAKFGKKFGAKVGEVTLPGAATQDQITDFTNENDYTPDETELSGRAHSITVTPQMRDAALKGLPLFDRYAAPKIPQAEQRKITGRVKQIVKQMAPGANLEVVDRLFSSEGTEVSGRFNAARQLISVALNYGDPETTVRHEVVHFLRESGLFTDEEWSLLEKEARRNWSRKHDVENLYPDLDRSAQNEEAIAQAFAEWKSGKGKHAPRFRRIFARIRDFFTRVANALRGMGYRTIDDVFERVESGRVGDRAPAQRGVAPDKQIKTPEFRRWFGNSKAVDASGKPLVVYHGTRGNVEAFDPKTLGKETRAKSAKEGFFFARDPAVASSYATDSNAYRDMPLLKFVNRITGGMYEKANEKILNTFGASAVSSGENVVPAYLSIQNPMEVDYGGSDYREATYASVIAKAKKAGHDGVILRNTADPGYGDDEAADAITDIYVAFNPAQIKSSIGNRGSFNPDDSRIAHSVFRRQAAPMYADPDPSEGHESEREIIGRVMGTTDKPLKERVRENIDAVKNRRGLAFKQAMLDQFAAVDALVQENEAKALEHWNNAMAPYMATRMTQNLQSVMAVVLRNGPIEVYNDPNIGTWFRAKTGWEHGGLEDIFTPLAEKGILDLWKGWAMAVRANRLKGEGREKLMSDSDIDTLLKLGGDPNDPSVGAEFSDFKIAHDKYQEFNRAMLDMAEGAGLINAEQRATWEKNDYVPFYRIMDDDVKAAGKGKGGIEGQRSGIRTLKGGEAAVNDIVENMVLNMTSLVDRSFKNMAMQKVTDLALDANVMETTQWKWFDKAEVPAHEVADRLMDIGVDVQGMTADQASSIFKFWHMRQPTDPDIVSVMVGGKPKFYRVHDPMLLRSISSMGPRPLGDIMKMFSLTKRALTTGVTIDPAFMIANAVRDTLSAWVVTGQKGFTPGTDSIKGLVKAMRTNDPSKLAIMASGGGTGGFYRTAPSDVRKQMDAKLRGIDQKTILDTPKKLWEFWRKVGQASESANRIALFDAAKANGGSDAEASFQALDLLDFAMRGDHAAMRHLIEAVPFLNARIQGLYRLQRGFQENHQTFLLRGAILTAATMALWAANEDDERYKELPDWDKDTYFHFWLGDQHFRLPKPFEVGVIFSTIPERIAAKLNGNDTWKHTGDSAKRAFFDTFAMNPTPQLFKPIIEQYANRNFFFDSPIVGRDLEGLPSGMQAKPWTSDTLQALGSATGASPVRTEALIRGYFGTIATYLLSASDALVARPLMDTPSKPSLRIDDVPVVKRFMRDDPPRTTRYINDFYKLRDEISETVAAIRELRQRGEFEAAAELMRDKGDKVRLRKGVDATARKLSAISKRMRVIERDRNMTPDEKRRESDRLIKMRTEFAKRMVTAVPATSRIITNLSDNNAAIGRL